ncbi:UNVERIFIED_CONTAM: hypothetical protein Slati_2237500 [Sesamum latifolium]|uniref:Uncharacterized protein n=1 Tax=Sesamum latifolium TaxID=2727402 RepID=A0AAW2WUP3_9LAMI
MPYPTLFIFTNHPPPHHPSTFNAHHSRTRPSAHPQADAGGERKPDEQGLKELGIPGTKGK